MSSTRKVTTFLSDIKLNYLIAVVIIMFQVVEISGLVDHLLTECDSKAEFQKCPRCTEAIPKSEYSKHSKEKLCTRKLQGFRTQLANMYHNNRGRLSVHHTLLLDMYHDNRGRLFAHHTLLSNMYHDNRS